MPETVRLRPLAPWHKVRAGTVLTMCGLRTTKTVESGAGAWDEIGVDDRCWRCLAVRV